MLLGQLAAAALMQQQHMQQRMQQSRMVNPLGPAESGSEGGGSAPPSVKCEEVFDNSPPPAESPPRDDSQASAVAEPSTLAVSKLDGADSRREAQPPLLLGSTAAKQSCAGLPTMLEFMATTQSMLGSKRLSEPPEVVDGSDEDGEEAEAPRRPRPKKARLSPPIAPAKAKSVPEPPKDEKVLKYPGTSKHPAIKYGRCTIYIDPSTQCWRLKKAPGTKDLVHFYFKAKKPEQVWKDVVKAVRKHAA